MKKKIILSAVACLLGGTSMFAFPAQHPANQQGTGKEQHETHHYKKNTKKDHKDKNKDKSSKKHHYKKNTKRDKHNEHK